MGVELAVASAVVGGGLSAAGKFMEGRERATAQRFESEQHARIAQENRIAADQTEARRRDQLTSSLGTIMAIRAGRGVGEASPTALAGMNEVIEDETRDMRTERLNYLTRAEQSRLASQMSRRQSRGSLLSSYIGAGAEIASTGYRVYDARRKSA
jgi:hypothetical protein